MKFTPLELHGAWLIEPELICDERGAFARTWCSREFKDQGLNTQLAQCNISFNHRQGTVRGMHYQRDPYGEVKLVRCTQGAILDVIVDVRPASPTYLQQIARELTASNRVMLYIPEGFAHGFQTLTDNTEVFYQMSREHHSASAAGVRWDDPAINIAWPLAISVISQRDQSWPDMEVAPVATLDSSGDSFPEDGHSWPSSPPPTTTLDSSRDSFGRSPSPATLPVAGGV